MKYSRKGKNTEGTQKRSDLEALHTGTYASRSLSLFLLFLSILAGMGALVYGLYFIVVRSRSVYGLVFYIAFGGLVLFYVLKAVRSGDLVRVLLKISVVLIKMILVFFCIGCVMLYGAFVVRRLVVGAFVTPPVAVLAVVLFHRFRIVSSVRKYFNNLQHRY
ncbi:MAG: hypothetical protein JXQ30_12875 [Spirochaetes bacterium]|nr:hypothetical protein [Spirochaetota bacterium]